MHRKRIIQKDTLPTGGGVDIVAGGIPVQGKCSIGTSADKPPCIEPFVSAAEVAKTLGLSTRSVRRMTKRKDLPYYFVTAGSVRFRLSEVEAAIERNRVPSRTA